MFKLNRTVDNIVERAIRPFVVFLHESLHLSPNQISLIAFSVSLVSVYFFLSGNTFRGSLFILVSLMLDKFDGSVAKLYHLVSKKGHFIDTISDRAAEFIIILSLVYTNLVDIKIALLSIFAIALLTLSREFAPFDLGGKRWLIALGYIIGFNIALHAVFIINLIAFIIDLLIMDYRFQKLLDETMEYEHKEISERSTRVLNRVLALNSVQNFREGFQKAWKEY